MSLRAQYPLEESHDYSLRSIRRPFNKRFPMSVGIVIGVLQMFLNGAIVGLEGGSVAYNPKMDTVYAGFWCSFAFFSAWVSMFAFLCFHKIFRWSLVVAGTNLASIAFAVILIVFDCLFIQNPCQCYLATICNADMLVSLDICSNADEKLRMVKGQLACAVTMLASNIAYLVVFIGILALSRSLRRPLTSSYRSSYKPMFTSDDSSPKVLSTLTVQTPTYPTSQQSAPYQPSYLSEYHLPTYPNQLTYWKTPAPHFNRLESC